MHGVEYPPAGSGLGGEDDVLEVGRPRLPRWVTVLAALLAAALVTGAIIARVHHQSDHAALPSPSSSPSGPAALVPRTADGGSLAPYALAVAIAGQRAYSLTPSALVAFDLPTMRQTAMVTLIPALGSTNAYFELLYDAVHASIWLVPIGGASSGRLMEFGAADLGRREDIPLPAAVTSAAVLDGEIYLGTAEKGLLGVAPGTRTVLSVPGAADDIGSMVPDPSRDRLLYLTGAVPVRVRSWSPGRIRSGAVGRLTFGRADLIVVDKWIWAAGFGAHGAVLVRLDPETLRPVQSDDRLAGELGSGAILAAAGNHDFLVRSDATVDPLWCVDAHTGEIEQRWAGPAGLVAAGGRAVLVVSNYSVRSLRLRGCAG